MKKLRIGCVLMAAGEAKRFGDDKLSADFEGKSLIQRAMEAIPGEELERVAVVSQRAFILEMAEKYGYMGLLNPHPEEGVSRTIAQGLEAMEGLDGVMFMVSDQPCLTRSSVKAQIECFRRQPDHIVAMAYGRRRGNPVIFPKEYYGELRELQGDVGGSKVIGRHQEKLKLYQVEEELELFDADSEKQLEELRELAGQRA